MDTVKHAHSKEHGPDRATYIPKARCQCQGHNDYLSREGSCIQTCVEHSGPWLNKGVLRRFSGRTQDVALNARTRPRHTGLIPSPKLLLSVHLVCARLTPSARLVPFHLVWLSRDRG